MNIITWLQVYEKLMDKLKTPLVNVQFNIESMVDLMIYSV